ncbi:MAG: B12-binding domain-containing radical SAM protein [Candidatus Pacebacteria bacterium]|nr:B12-binding domain-containing radical SAM protein [Candidatus Paceibacterota bacterium]
MSAHICLIIPPSPFLLDERVFPFLGILKVAAALERAGQQVEVLDLSGYKNYLDAVAEHVRTTTATAFGITATTPQMPAAAHIAQTIRGIKPASRIILGGTHATLVAASLKSDNKRGRVGRAHRAFAQLESYFDVVIAGDGERSIFLAIQDTSPKFIDADNSKDSTLFLKDSVSELEEVFPARHLIDIESYHYQIEGQRATSLIAQLGCPFPCGFCGGRKSPMLRHIRTRSTASIIEEMVQVYRHYGHTGFMFYDDELNVSTSMVDLMQAIARTQKDLGVEWRLRGFIKSELFTDEQAEAMYEAGFRWILVGFESGSPRILENIRKQATQEDNTTCMDIARRHGLKVKALMSLGHPGESPDTIRSTQDWLVEVRPADFDATIITPYPGSPYYDDAEATSEDGVWVYTTRNGDTLYEREVDYTEVADYYKGKPGENYVSHVWTDSLSPEDLVRARDSLEQEVRTQLNISFNPGAAAMLYEHSMGQSNLPDQMLRTSS